MSALATPPLALYVHLPWCVRKCPYCDFNSHQAPASLPTAAYVGALLDDLDHAAASVCGRPLESIFFGGGTPSLFPPTQIARLLRGIRARIACAPDLEVTMEANPGTIERGRFLEYRESGITRVSLGAQSFDVAALAALGRIHSPEHTAQAVAELLAAELTNFNLDLMYGLPGQTLEAAVTDVQRALALGAQHISHYQLTLEPGTAFYRRPPRLPGVDLLFEMQEACQELLAAAGLRQYEVSAYAVPGVVCRHNLNYWEYGDYVGIGAGAHGKWSDPAASRILRSVRCRHPREYLRARTPADRVESVTEVPQRDRAFEFMLNALRLRRGFTRALFEARTGLPLEAIDRPLTEAGDRGLIEGDDGRWRATDLGFRFLNDLQTMFLPELPGERLGRDQFASL